MSNMELTKGEAFAVAEFIDMNIFDAIRNDTDWDSFQNLRDLIHAYEKCCAMSGSEQGVGCEHGKAYGGDRGWMI